MIVNFSLNSLLIKSHISSGQNIDLDALHKLKAAYENWRYEKLPQKQ
jgi:hypothetical protein